jgi:hypothetical protein
MKTLRTPRRATGPTKGDLIGAVGEAKVDIIKWCVGSIFMAAGLFAAIVKTFS